MTAIPTRTTLMRAIEGSCAAIQSLAALAEPVDQAVTLISQCLTDGGKLLICGNGGSAADAAHMATEFVCRFQHDRRPYPAICLGDSGSSLTAIGNDYAFDDVFARQVRAFGRPGDVLIVFTTSGNSRNVLHALNQARQSQVKSIALLGRDGGESLGVADVELLVACEVTARVQEAQKLLLHVLCEAVDARIPDE